MTMPAREHGAQLRRGLGFSESDLLANQRGELTERQRELVRAKRRQYLRNGGLTGLAMWLIFSVVIMAAVLAQGAKPQDMAVLPFALAGLTALFGFAWLYSRFRGRHLIQERVSQTDGPAQTKSTLHRTRFGSFTAYELRVGGKLFRLMTEQELSAFQSGVVYRIYYVQYAPLHLLLSADVLAGEAGVQEQPLNSS